MTITYGVAKYSGIVESGVAGGETSNIVSTNTIQMVKSNRYIVTDSSVSTTLVLPASASLNDTVYIVISNGRVDNVINRNGHKIMGLEENLVIDRENVSFGLIYVDVNLGWRIL